MKEDGHQRADDVRFRALLAVRDQLDMLHKFKGVLSEEEMSRRRKDLYESMPPVPLHNGTIYDDELDDGDTSPQQKKPAI